MSAVVEWFRDTGHRGYLYRVLAGLGLVAVAYGLVSGDELGLWLGFAGTVLGTGTAAVNTPTGAQIRAAERHAHRRDPEPRPKVGEPGPGRDVRRKFDR